MEIITILSMFLEKLENRKVMWIVVKFQTYKVGIILTIVRQNNSYLRLYVKTGPYLQR